MTMQNAAVIDISPNNIREQSACGYNSTHTDCYSCKVSWLDQHYAKGLTIKSVMCDNGCSRGMIEYIPGEYSWRPVNAEGYVFIHCLFTGFKEGNIADDTANSLLTQCLKDAKKQKKNGVAVIARTNSIITGSRIFLNNGFEVADTSGDNFLLLVKKLKKKAVTPSFKENWNNKFAGYPKGMIIIREDSCPFTQQNIREIIDTSEKFYGITPKVVLNKTFDDPLESPCGFGSFSIIYNGEIISYHPISANRFKNVMDAII